MILYFDSYITDQPLQQGLPELRQIESRLRHTSQAYRPQTKLDITKYTLASYASIPWSHVLIKYELADPSGIPSFDEYVRRLFPSAEIVHNRSATQAEYSGVIAYLKTLGDEWIFYAPNNDHVMVCPDASICDPLLQKARQLAAERGTFVSICYSHFSEMCGSAKADHLVRRFYCPDAIPISDDAVAVAEIYPRGTLDGMQIVHIDLLHAWFVEQDCGDARIIRSESLAPFIKPPTQIVIKPKVEVCRHYDAYMHTVYAGRPMYISPSAVPPLFIPEGFFESAIRIAYGYDHYRPGWVNVNPLKAAYSFEDPVHGTDLMCDVNDLPAFWRSRTVEVDVNPQADLTALSNAAVQKQARVANPWREIGSLQAAAFLAYRRLATRWPWLKHVSRLVKNPAISG